MGKKFWKILLRIAIIVLLIMCGFFLLSKIGVAGTIIISIILSLVAYKLFFSGKFAFRGRSSKKKKKHRRTSLTRAMIPGLSDWMKSNVRIIEKGEDLPNFNDVAGLDEAKASLQETVRILKDPRKFEKIGARVPKGVLLVGPPGTGKTLLARATAGEAGVTFLSINGPEFVEAIVGTGASRVRDLFSTARACAYSKKHGGAIVFIDEIDAIGKSRVGGMGGGDEREQALNQIFVEMDGFDKDDNIVVMAATNRPEMLDSALMRPGRFDRKVIVDRPDKNGRRDILKIHTRNKRLAEDVDLDKVARATPGSAGADLENLANEAALLAASQGKKRIEMVDFEKAIDIVTIGPQRKSRIISKPEREITAYHEAGHALVAALVPEIEPLQKISIIPAGLGLGYTKILPEQDRYLYTKDYLFARVELLLGGRVAEEVVFGREKISTGAADDLKKSTELIWQIVCDFGMSDLGPLIFGRKEESMFLSGETARQKTYSDETARKIDEEVMKILGESYGGAQKLIEKNRSKLDALARALLIDDELEREEILKILGIEDNAKDRF